MLDAMDKTQNKRLLAPERGEPERSAGEPNGGANNLAAISQAPDPEVLAKPQRRRFTPAYKARIVEEAQRCTEPGHIGALLRREGLYSSALTQWRRQYQSGALQALKDDKRGRKRTRDARDQELERLQRENERLNKKLRQAELIIEIQKKVAAMLGNPIETPQNSEGIS
ncbi:MAG: transposase [Planctomycetota bacterium]|nr:transposase [Planctomycetota bacterium]